VATLAGCAKLMLDPVYQLQTAGYTLLKGSLSASSIDGLRAALDQMMAEDDESCGAATLEAMEQRGALRNLCDRGGVLKELLADSPVYALLDQMLGDNYVLHSYDGLVLLPGYGRYPWDFHTDFEQLRGLAFPANQTVGVNCLYYIDEVTERNGGTWLVPASHHCLLTHIEPADAAALAFQAVGEAGDILLFDARLLHCAGTNESEMPRRLIKALYCPPWLRPQMDYTRAIRPEIRDQLDPRTLRIIGVGTSPPASVAALRQQLSQEDGK
jgi:ectoine hydroxylase-related dioxygenase (phytanoyl-CoA dioxygenase family)